MDTSVAAKETRIGGGGGVEEKEEGEGERKITGQSVRRVKERVAREAEERGVVFAKTTYSRYPARPRRVLGSLPYYRVCPSVIVDENSRVESRTETVDSSRPPSGYTRRRFFVERDSPDKLRPKSTAE